MNKKAIIIGAGPAGLTTAHKLLTTTNIVPVILERSGDIGKTSENVSYKANRMDMGLYRILSRLKKLFYTPKNSAPSCEEVAQQVKEMGGAIYLHQLVYTTYAVGREVCSIHAINTCTGELTLFRGDYFFSTVPARELMTDVEINVSAKVKTGTFVTEEQYKNFFLISNRSYSHLIFKTLS